MLLQQERIARYCCRINCLRYVTKMLGIAAKRDCEVSHISRIKPCMFLGDLALCHQLPPLLLVLACEDHCCANGPAAQIEVTTHSLRQPSPYSEVLRHLYQHIVWLLNILKAWALHLLCSTIRPCQYDLADQS